MKLDSKYIPWVIVLVLLGILGFQWYSQRAANNQLPTTNTPAIIGQTTEVSTEPKASPQDPDVKLTQTYTAEINGQKVTVPVKSSGPSGVTGVIKQEADMTKVINQALAAEEKLLKEQLKPAPWEVSAGIGVHDGDYYVPIELQRNYSKDKAISVEVHQDLPDIKKTTGGELKHTWKF